MSCNLTGRNLLTLMDYEPEEIKYLLDSARTFQRLKRAGEFPKPLQNKNLAFIFLKPSCRTRSAAAVASADVGATATILGAEEIRFGIKESLQDIARVLGRMFDGIGIRGFAHQTIRTVAEFAGVPVWNYLCDQYHPTQVLADLMTIQAAFGEIRGIKIAYVGDGRNNMVRSLVIGAVKMGLDFRIVAPPSLHPSEKELQRINGAGSGMARVYEDIADGVRDCQVIYGDTWVSMGEEDIVQERIEQLSGYKISMDTMAATHRDDTILLHCLPALHDNGTEFAEQYSGVLDVDDDVFEGPQSRVFDQAENRMHTIKALMVATIVENSVWAED